MVPSGLYQTANHCHSTSAFGDSSQLAYCDMSTDGGGWLVIQRRLPNGNTNFTRNWQDYEEGFGNLDGEFWYGLRNIHCLTHSGEMELRIDMETTDGVAFNWTYQTIQVNGSLSFYSINLGSGNGTMSSNAMSSKGWFNTYDMNLGSSTDFHCAQSREAGWWFDNNCGSVNLNGRHDAESSAARIWWYSTSLTLRKVEMKIRPTGCASGIIASGVC